MHIRVMKFWDADNSYSCCEHRSWWLNLCHRSDILECIIGEEPVVEGLMCPLHADRVIQVASQWQDLWPQPSLWHWAQISPRLLVNDSTEKPKDVQLHQNRGGTPSTWTSVTFHNHFDIDCKLKLHYWLLTPSFFVRTVSFLFSTLW